MKILEKKVIGRNVVELVIGSSLMRQRFHVRISDINGNILLTSEKYRDRSHAVRIMNRFVDAMEGKSLK